MSMPGSYNTVYNYNNEKVEIGCCSYRLLSHQGGTSHVVSGRRQVASDTWHGDSTPRLHTGGGRHCTAVILNQG